LKNLRRGPNVTSPILKPRAAEIVKKHGEASEAGMAYPDPLKQFVDPDSWRLGVKQAQEGVVKNLEDEKHKATASQAPDYSSILVTIS
jgi:hypothetical protein